MPVSSPRASARSYRIAPPAFHGDINRALETAIPDPVTRRPLIGLLWQIVEWQRLTAGVVNSLMDGKDNAVSTVTLTASVATSTIVDGRLGPDTLVVLVPTTANAAAELGNGTLYQTLPNATKGQAVLNHANNAQTDRDFGYALRG